MESILFIVLMVAGHILMMFVMPGMHGGHNHKGQLLRRIASPHIHAFVSNKPE